METTLSVNTTPHATIPPPYLSVAIDTAQVIGKNWWAPHTRKAFGLTGNHSPEPFDFSRQKLIDLARPLAPAYLRISGTACDDVLFEEELTKNHWDAINTFAQECGFKIIFGLNAGKHTRDRKKNWLTKNAEKIITHTHQKNYPVSVWELGNEPNGFIARGPRWKINGAQYAHDIATAHHLIKSISPDYQLAGPGSAFWPRLGEPFALTESFLKNLSVPLDILSWHYYPQQSDRSLFATRRARPHTLLNSKNLDEINTWIKKIQTLRNTYAPSSSLWITETGNAQCGGQPGVSDRFVSSLWWLDTLGKMAQEDHHVIVRQTLAGGNYGLINNQTLTPNPDYWASLLWKKLMGPTVYKTTSSNPKIRTYTHNSLAKENHLTTLALNLSNTTTILSLSSPIKESYLITSPSLSSTKTFLNNKKLTTKTQDTTQQLTPVHSHKSIFELPPHSYCFLTTTL